MSVSVAPPPPVASSAGAGRHHRRTAERARQHDLPRCRGLLRPPRHPELLHPAADRGSLAGAAPLSAAVTGRGPGTSPPPRSPRGPPTAPGFATLESRAAHRSRHAVFSYQGSAFYSAGTALDPVTFLPAAPPGVVPRRRWERRRRIGPSRGAVDAAPTPPASGLTVDADDPRRDDQTGSGFAPNGPASASCLLDADHLAGTSPPTRPTPLDRGHPATIEPGEHR